MTANLIWKVKSPPTIVGVNKLECFCYLIVKTASSYLHLSWYNIGRQQTDGQTDGFAVTITRLALCAVARKTHTIHDSWCLTASDVSISCRHRCKKRNKNKKNAPYVMLECRGLTCKLPSTRLRCGAQWHVNCAAGCRSSAHGLF